MNLQDFRKKYPQYSDISDQKLADSIYKKYYSNIPVDEFYSLIDYQPSPTQDALSMGITPFGMSEEEVAQSIREQQEIAKFTGLMPEKKEEVKLTEKELKQDPKWIESSKKIYQLNEGEDAPKLDSDEQYANYGLRYMGWFNYNLPKMTLEATQLTQANDDQKSAFVDLMDMYDQKQASLKGFGRAVAGLASDPTTYLGIGTFGTATAGAQALKQGIKAGVKEATKVGIKQGAKVGALEGAAYTAADNALRQSARITAGEQESFDPIQKKREPALVLVSMF